MTIGLSLLEMATSSSWVVIFWTEPARQTSRPDRVLLVPLPAFVAVVGRFLRGNEAWLPQDDGRDPEVAAAGKALPRTTARLDAKDPVLVRNIVLASSPLPRRRRVFLILLQDSPGKFKGVPALAKLELKIK